MKIRNNNDNFIVVHCFLILLNFYNDRRSQLKEVEPNEGHKQLIYLEEKYNVHIITQNVDDLHERAGSKNIIHVHGSLLEARSSNNMNHIVNIGTNNIKIGDLCPDAHQLRPNVVWFGESVMHIKEAENLSREADVFIIIGTSLEVYPVAGLVGLTKETTPIYVINPGINPIRGRQEYMTFIQKNATEGVKEVVDILLNN